MKALFPIVLALFPMASALAAPAACSVAINNDPVVIRMNKDEFRIAFGVTGEQCRETGCSGVIRYKAEWRTEDGAEAVDSKLLSYDIPSGSQHSIAVDRHYFDTSEGRHTTDVVKVSVDDVSCARPRLTAGW